MEETNDRGGRPTEYRARFAGEARRLCLLGATNEDLAEFFGVSTVTLNNWMHAHRRFLHAIQRGRERADARVAKSLYRRALGYSHRAVKIMQHEGKPLVVPFVEHYPPDTAAASLWLRNRQPKRWRDKQEVEVSGEVSIASALAKARARADSTPDGA